MITGEYHFAITKDGDWYIATGVSSNSCVICTQGRTEEEIFEMVADSYLSALEIKCHWWNKFLSKLMI